MATDIFNRNSGTVKGAFSADKLRFTFSGNQNLIVQSMNVNYGQPVQKLYDLADPDGAYYVAGRPQGTAQMAKILGPAASVRGFYSTYGDVCNTAQPINFRTDFGCSGSGGASGSFNLTHPVVSAFGMAVTVNNAIVTENTTLMFHSISF
tara:strand:+ start:715 stop:1164 length:450 start_codon:yes stop_codon:yes gene_type:complete